MVLHINVKGVGGVEDTSVQCRDDATVLNLKEQIQLANSIVPSQQKIIFKGRVLEDHMELQAVGIGNDTTIFLVKTKSTDAPAPARTPARGASSNPFGDSSENAMWARLQQAPAMRQIMSNPEFLRTMMRNSPEMQELMRNNPQIARQMQDPEMLRRAMQAATNPEIMREMTRNNDRTMANIEAHPEGFNMLRRMYNEVQEPMMDAAAARRANQRNANTGAPAPASAAPVTPNAEPLPDPWAAPASAPSPGLGSMANLAALGLPGFGRPPSGSQQQAGQSSSSGAQGPWAQQQHAMMSQLLRDDSFIDQMSEMHPGMGNLRRSNPSLFNGVMSRLRNMSPEDLMRVASSPQAVRARELFGPAGFTFGQPGDPPPAPAPAPIRIERDAEFNEALNKALAAMAEGSDSEDEAEDGASAPARARLPALTAAETYPIQMLKLRRMGFADDDQSRRALERTGGNLNQAVGLILANKV